MITSTHGILAFWFNKFLNHRLKTRMPAKYIIIGSTLPDFFHVSNWFLVKIGGSAWHQEFLLDISKFLHSLPIFAVTFILFSFFVSILLEREVYYKCKAFFYGWGLFHITIDILTHKSEGWPYFWPWLNWKINGLFDHFSPIFWFIELTVTGIFLFLLARKKIKK